VNALRSSRPDPISPSLMAHPPRLLEQQLLVAEPSHMVGLPLPHLSTPWY
jgi:hypothetical protein